MAKKLTTEEIEKFHKMYLEGMTCEKIGKLTGHKTETVSKYLKENYGIKPQRKIDLLVLSKLAKEGKTTKEMAEYFNVHPSAICY
jgi:DNA-binding CsgD family transcriptional regulator